MGKVRPAQRSEHAPASAASDHGEEEIRLLFANVTDYAILLLDRQGRVNSWNTGDAGLLKQVFVNLVDNAFKYTRRRDEAHVDIGSREIAGERVFSVRDDGVGFDTQYASKLFGVFQRMHRAEDFEGSGVGLAIEQRIVQRHGGRIWAEAAVDRGATFHFTVGSPSHD
jgi:light-regulated signal transduction histidine kinase (bacteriophytochrome)